MSPTLNLTRDYSRFVITFYDLISTSAPHIYISALPLSPQTSMVHEMYNKYKCPLVRVVHGLPTSWEPVVATVYNKDFHSAAVWSPCNRFIAVAKSEVVEIHDAVTLNLLHSFRHPQDSGALQLSFSPDSHFLTQFNYGDIITWDLQTGSSVGTVMPKGMSVDHRDFSSTYSVDGKMLAILYQGGSGESYFIATHNLFTTHTHLYHVLEGRITPPIFTCGKFLQFVTVKSRHITLWEVEFTLTHPPAVVQCWTIPDGIADTEAFNESLFLPTFFRLAIAFQNRLLVWDAQGSKLLLNISPVDAHTMTFSSNGHFFACILRNTNEVHVWKESSASYTLYQTLEFATFRVYAGPLLSPDGESIVVSLQSIIHLWHTRDPMFSSGPTLPEYQHDFLLGFSPNEAMAAFAHYLGNTVTVLDLQSGDPVLAIDTGVEIKCLGITENTIAVAGKRKIITWNLAMQNPRANISDSAQSTTFDLSPPSCGHTFIHMSVSPNLSYVATLRVALQPLSTGLEIYDVSTGRCLAGVTLNTGMLKLLFIPNEFQGY
jgi:WD40 repeat protein